MSNYIELKINLVINKLTEEQYKKADIAGLIKEDQLYMITDDVINAHGLSIKNLADPVELSDAVNVNYLSNNYYTKSEVSSANEVNTVIDTISSAISSKVLVDGVAVEQFEAKNISLTDYANLLKSESTLSNTLYIVDYDNLDAEGERILNVADPVEDSDAVNKHYLEDKYYTKSEIDNMIGNIDTILKEIVG